MVKNFLYNLRRLIVCLLLVFLVQQLGAQHVKPSKKVLLVFASSAKFPFVDLFKNGFKDEMSKNKDFEYDLSLEFVDHRFIGEHAFNRDIKQLFIDKYKDDLPDLVVYVANSPDNFKLDLKAIFPHIPVILACEGYTYKDKFQIPDQYVGVAGVLELKHTIDVIKKLQPATAKINVIVGNMERENDWVAMDSAVFNLYKDKLKFEILQKMPLSHLIEKVRHSEPTTVNLYYYFIKDYDNKFYLPIAVLNQLRAVSLVPIYGLYQQYVGEGSIGGYTFSWTLFGRKIARLCDEELKGMLVSNKKFTEVKCSEYTFDYKILKHYGLNSDLLPKGSILINREYTFWELYHDYVIAVLCFIIVETLLIFALVINRASRIKANREILRINEDLEQKVLERTVELERTNTQLSEELMERTRFEQMIIESEHQLRELVATKDKFFSIIAHDLRNPFNSLLGFSNLLVNNVEQYPMEKIKHLANVLNTTSKQSYALLENLLEWSRLQSGSLVIHPINLRASDLAKEVKCLCDHMAVSKEIDLSVVLEADACIYADEEMIKTVLRNLVTNALKFSFPGGRVQIVVQRILDDVLFTVSDNGIGITQEDLAKLFKIECKLSSSGTAEEKGTGLGLILCKEFIDKHSGKIWAESQIGTGSNFKFSLPCTGEY